jgi:Glycosyltransferase family 87
LNFHQLNLAECAAALLLLAVATGLMVVAQWRNWRPSLTLAVYTAVVLRLVMLALTYHVRPWDLAYDFQDVGFATLHHRDPILATAPVVRWSYLPVYDFVLAAAYWAHIHLHISWLITARLPAIASDTGVTVLVGTVAGAAGGRAELRRFQYACNPLAILVSAVHGQVDPACLLFSLAAFAVVLRAGPQISGRAAATAGLLLGLGIGAKTWPVLFGPALLLALPSARRRWQFAAAAGGTVALLFVSMPLTVGTPVSKLPALFKIMTYYHPPIGNWGWAGVWVVAHPTKLATTVDPLWINVGSYGAKLAVLGALLAVWWWRRAHPLDIATATTTALLAITPAFGVQYLLWQAPTRTAYPAPLSLPLQIVVGAYAALLYLPMTMLKSHYWLLVDKYMVIASLAVIALMIAAMPWGYRVWHRPAEPHPMPECTTDNAVA